MWGRDGSRVVLDAIRVRNRRRRAVGPRPHHAAGSRAAWTTELGGLRDPDEVWLTAVERDGRVVYRRQFFAGFAGEANAAYVVADEQLDGSWAWTFFTMRRRRDVNNRRRGRLLYRKADDGG